jgi:AhpC/TSA family
MTDTPMLQRGDSVPRFEVKTVGGELFSYSTIWQRRHLVLLALPAAQSEAAETYISELMARRSEFTAKDAECVVTGDRVPGIHSPAAIVADRWGEIVHIATTSRVEDLASPEELLDWVDYLQRRCPECEGEAK